MSLKQERKEFEESKVDLVFGESQTTLNSGRSSMSSFHLSERVDTCEVSESDEEGDKVIRQFVTKFY